MCVLFQILACTDKGMPMTPATTTKTTTSILDDTHTNTTRTGMPKHTHDPRTQKDARRQHMHWDTHAPASACMQPQYLYTGKRLPVRGHSADATIQIWLVRKNRKQLGGELPDEAVERLDPAGIDLDVYHHALPVALAEVLARSGPLTRRCSSVLQVCCVVPGVDGGQTLHRR